MHCTSVTNVMGSNQDTWNFTGAHIGPGRVRIISSIHLSTALQKRFFQFHPYYSFREKWRDTGNMEPRVLIWILNQKWHDQPIILQLLFNRSHIFVISLKHNVCVTPSLQPLIIFFESFCPKLVSLVNELTVVVFVYLLHACRWH